jgi:hypothetical protein
MVRTVSIALSLLAVSGSALAQAPAAEAPDPPAQLLKEALAIERKTAKLRGLRVRRPIAKGIQTRAEILRRVEQKLAREYTDAEVRAEAAVLQRLGLLPAGTDYKAAVLALLKDQVAGYYDPVERKLHLADWIPLSLQGPALAHEICHALQDQHFALKKLIKPLKENTDRQLAQAALVEGDCTGVMVEYTLAPQGLDLGDLGGPTGKTLKDALAAGSSPKLKSTPRYLRETLLFPYLSGLALIQKVRALHPWSTVSAMFKRPPESTEQVLHPEKYWSNERPVAIKWRPLPSLAEYEKLRIDVLGEFQLSIYLGLGVEDAVAARAAEGWAGDLLLALRKKGEADAAPPLLVHLTSWDSAADALEFANAQRHVLAARKLKPIAAAADEAPGIHRYLEARGGLEWSVQLTGEQVLILHGVPAPLRAALAREVWQLWRVGGKRVTPR